MTPEARQKLHDEVYADFGAESIIRLLDEIDNRDAIIEGLAERISSLASGVEKFIAGNNRRFATVAHLANQIAVLIQEHNDNLTKVFQVINEAERTLFAGEEKGAMRREDVSRFFHDIRKAFYEVLNPAVPVSLSSASGQFTADGETPDATTQL